ncbi:MAG: hypothetical protein FWF35_02855 [Elusimicrobia bacterium]|nr:hypothetical protein [Elusimicrobiota bacterium]
MKKIILAVLAALLVQNVSAQVQSCKEAAVNPAAAKTAYKADFNNDGTDETLFICTENNRLYLRFSVDGKRVQFSKELEIADADFFKTQDYLLSMPMDRHSVGADFRIFEVRKARNGGNGEMTPIAFPLMRNAQLSGILYGSYVRTVIQDLARDTNTPNKITFKNFETEISVRPEFETNPLLDNFTLVSMYENTIERSPSDITLFDPQTNKTLRLVNAFGDESKKLQSIFVWQAKGLKQMYSRH